MLLHDEEDWDNFMEMAVQDTPKKGKKTKKSEKETTKMLQWCTEDEMKSMAISKGMKKCFELLSAKEEKKNSTKRRKKASTPTTKKKTEKANTGTKKTNQRTIDDMFAKNKTKK